MNLKVLTPAGEQSGEVVVDDSVFAAKINVPLMHQIVTAQLAAARSGTHSTKTRAEVRGGGAKPWRQKGTGRARHGSSREPQWKGGGVTFGPKPRDHSVSVPKKMKALALRSALSVRARDGKVIVADGFTFDKPKTKEAIAALKAWNVEGKALLVLTTTDDDVKIAYAFRNLQRIHVIAEHQLNVYDILNADHLIFGRAALEAFQSRVTGGVRETSNTGGVRGVAEPSTAAGSVSDELPVNEGEARETPRSNKKDPNTEAPGGGVQ